MIEKETTFFSEGSRLKATLYYPDDLPDEGPHPAIIVNSGYPGSTSSTRKCSPSN